MSLMEKVAQPGGSRVSPPAESGAQTRFTRRSVLGGTSRAFLLLFSYLGVALLFTWPLALNLTTHFPGASTDALLHYWNSWWVATAFAEGVSPFYTHYLFYPEGASLVYHNIAWFNSVVWLALRPLLHDYLAHNLVILLTLVFSGAALYLLVYSLTRHRVAAFVAGLIYLAWPFRLSQLDHPNLLSTQWIPLFLLFLLLTVRRAHMRLALVTGLLLALVGYTRWQLLIPAALMGATLLLLTWPDWYRRRETWRALLLAGILALILLAPPLFLLANQLGSEEATADDFLREGEESLMQTDLLAYVTPPAGNPLLGQWSEEAYERYYPLRDSARRFPAYVGITTLLLAAAGIWWYRRETIPWVMIALLLVLLALGATLRVNGRLYEEVPTLYRMLEPLYILRLMRVPDRFNLFLALPVSVLAAYGVAGLAPRVRQRVGVRGAGVLALLLVMTILLEYWQGPVPLQPAESSPFYRFLATEGDPGAVLNLPIDHLRAKQYMFAQTVHERPLLQGHISRVPPGAYAYIDGHPWLRVLRQSGEMDPWQQNVGQQLRSLAADGVKYLLLNRALVGARTPHWQRYLPTAPVYEDELLLAYRTEPVVGRDFNIQQELAPGLGPTQPPRLSATCRRPGEVLEVDVSWGTEAGPARVYEVVISLVDRSGETLQSERFPLLPGQPTATWPANALVWGYYPLSLSPALATGEHDVTLALAEPGKQANGPGLKSGTLVISGSACPVQLPEGAIATNARYGDQLRLLGYQLEREDLRLWLTLYWRAEQRMMTEYKVFVHVFDPATGVPVAQDDAQPMRGGYPTRFWWPGEVIADRVPVYLEGAPAGAYGLAIGVYHPLSGERLPLADGYGNALPDGRLVLPNEMVLVD